MNYRWANSERRGIVKEEAGRLVYLDSGEEFEAAKAGEFGEISEPRVIVEDKLPSADDIAAERASMRVTPLQGKLALGEARWARIEALLDDPATPWAMRMAITSATEWRRDSQTVDELGWLLQLTDEDKDRLFRIAATIKV